MSVRTRRVAETSHKRPSGSHLTTGELPLISLAENPSELNASNPFCPNVVSSSPCDDRRSNVPVLKLRTSQRPCASRCSSTPPLDCTLVDHSICGWTVPADTDAAVQR